MSIPCVPWAIPFVWVFLHKNGMPICTKKTYQKLKKYTNSHGGIKTWTVSCTPQRRFGISTDCPLVFWKLRAMPRKKKGGIQKVGGSQIGATVGRRFFLSRVFCRDLKVIFHVPPRQTNLLVFEVFFATVTWCRCCVWGDGKWIFEASKIRGIYMNWQSWEKWAPELL